ncbi:MAG TPA: ribose-phosphate diphosphokinase [Pseudolabrys sp.]|nr:ribose-phosphate diphosphokinase [Pseudolabrys sp.]
MNIAAIHPLPDSGSEGARLASRLNVPMVPIEIHRFPDGELRVTANLIAETSIIYGSLDHPSDKLLALLFAAEALRRQGARRLVLVAPYLCYMRQDTAFHAGEAISQKVVGELLAAAFDRVITVDAHLHRTKSIRDVFPGIESEDVSSMPAVAETLRGSGLAIATIVVGPDQESEAWVTDLAARLGLGHAVGHKARRGDRSVVITFDEASRLESRPILLIDDIVSTGGTLIACAKALVDAGVTTIDAVVTHALFAPELTTEFLRAGIRSVRSTCTVPHPSNAIALDAILAEALRVEVGP